MSSNGDADIGRWEAEGGPAPPDEPDARPRAARYADHVSEIELELRAPTMTELFVQAGEALADLMLGEGHALPPGPLAAPVTVTLEAADAPALLIAWLEELIYRADADHAVFTRFDITSLEERRLTATLRGFMPADLRNPVKAATYHGLHIDRDTDGSFTSTIVLDV